MNSRFAQLKNLIKPKEILIFILGQIEIINNNLYINAKDISCINTNSTTKKITEYNSHYDISQTNFHPLKCTKNNKINEYSEDLSEKNSTDNELNTEKSNNKTDSDQKYKNIELKNTNMIHNTRKSRKNTVNNDDE
ncbi:hypothetical protein C2G38_2052597 [Gigaspora rosea]|uniref:Uncharacterized protein n=1 Tax=Gigaspora rosea TaxID=44941 RepID=A0A397W8Y0_9GLOM|nr:hypothetical protein C2G38_2052597 [Gigaspora rosea]